MNTLFIIVFFTTVATVVVVAVPLAGYRLQPGIIYPKNIGNITRLYIPRGGAYVKSLVDNTEGPVGINVTITGQACDIGDPLVFFYTIEDWGEEVNPVLLFLPEETFYYTFCGGPSSSFNIAYNQKWALIFIWDGEKFVNSEDNC